MGENFRLGFWPIRVFFAGFWSFCTHLLEEVFCWGWTLFYAGFWLQRVDQGHVSVLECGQRPVSAVCLCVSRRRTADLMSAREVCDERNGHNDANRSDRLVFN